MKIWWEYGKIWSDLKISCLRIFVTMRKISSFFLIWQNFVNVFIIKSQNFPETLGKNKNKDFSFIFDQTKVYREHRWKCWKSATKKVILNYVFMCRHVVKGKYDISAMSENKYGINPPLPTDVLHVRLIGSSPRTYDGLHSRSMK